MASFVAVLFALFIFITLRGFLSDLRDYHEREKARGEDEDE